MSQEGWTGVYNMTSNGLRDREVPPTELKVLESVLVTTHQRHGCTLTRGVSSGSTRAFCRGSRVSECTRGDSNPIVSEIPLQPVGHECSLQL